MVDHASWLDQVRSELKGRALESFDYIWDGERISPFEEFQIKPKQLWPTRSGVWTIDAKMTWGNQPNQQMLAVLALGATSLSLVVDDQRKWKSVFKGVHLDWLQHQWYVATPDLLEPLLQSLSKSITPVLNGVCWLPQLHQTKASLAFKHQLPKFRFITMQITATSSSADLANSWDGVIKSIKHLAETSSDGFRLPAIAIEYIGGDDLILNICMIRAMRLIWRHVLKSFDQDLDHANVYVATKVWYESKTDADHMIRASLVAASLVLGGADSVTIDPPHAQEDYGWGIKAQHIMHYESRLDNMVDPFSGSFVVERLTDVIARKVWAAIAMS